MAEKQSPRKLEQEGVLTCLREYSPFARLPVGDLQIVAACIERGIHNAAYDKACEKCIPLRWDNENFVAQYSSVGYDVKINLDINSSINAGREDEIRYYVAERVYNWVILRYTRALALHHNPDSAPVWQAVEQYLATIGPDRLGYLSFDNLNPLINKPYIDQLKIREKQETQIKYSTMYSCKSCGNRKIITYLLQTRGLDEGSTQFFRCLTCQKIWSSYT